MDPVLFSSKSHEYGGQPMVGRSRLSVSERAEHRRQDSLRWYYRHRARICGRNQRRRYERLFGPGTVRELSDIERAWLGALIEGEGHVSYCPRGARREVRATIEITNTEVETIATCVRFAGAGGVYLCRPRDGHQPLWHWRLGKKGEILMVLRQVWPYLTGKQDRALSIINVLEEERRDAVRALQQFEN